MLDVDINPENFKGMPEELNANQKVSLAASRTVLETVVKVDENRLRKQQIDTMPSLLKEIAAFELRELAAPAE